MICQDCNSYRLCESCEDLIHSMGVYEKHNWMAIKEFENTPVWDWSKSNELESCSIHLGKWISVFSAEDGVGFCDVCVVKP